MIIPAKEFVLNSVKDRMEEEIQYVNGVIQAAEKSGKHSCRIEKDKMSAETRLAFLNAGYDVDFVIRYKASYTEISWKRQYYALLEKKRGISEVTDMLSNKVLSPRDIVA